MNSTCLLRQEDVHWLSRERGKLSTTLAYCYQSQPSRKLLYFHVEKRMNPLTVS